MARVLQRVVLIAVAVLAVGWLAAGLNSSRLLARAEHPHAGDDLGDRLDRLERAEFLNPSTEFDVRAAQILLEGGDARGATRLLRDVVRREPDNRQAWAGLVQSQEEMDPAAARRAFNELPRLVPPVDEAGTN